MADTSPNYIDLLTEDRTIANQKFACISFVSPENIIKQKNEFFFEEFLKQWEFKKTIEKYTQFLNFIAYKYELNFDSLTTDLTDFVDNEKASLSSNIHDEYKTFVDLNEEQLDATYNNSINFNTSVRGIKIRGVFPTQEEAELRCKLLREVDPNHDVYVGPVGLWMPWEPEAYKTGRVEYLEEELNKLMHEKRNNEIKAKQEFDKRVLETKQQAIEENKKKALEHGNKLTQNIDKEGNLYSVDNTGKNNEITVEELKKELFESDDVVVGDSDHGYSRLTQNNSEKISDASENIIEVIEDTPEEKLEEEETL